MRHTCFLLMFVGCPRTTVGLLCASNNLRHFFLSAWACRFRTAFLVQLSGGSAGGLYTGGNVRAERETLLLHSAFTLGFYLWLSHLAFTLGAYTLPSWVGSEPCLAGLRSRAERGSHSIDRSRPTIKLSPTNRSDLICCFGSFSTIRDFVGPLP